MKKTVFLALSVFVSIISSAQSSNCTGGDYGGGVIDSISFDSSNPGYTRVIIDTTFINNIWQIGTVTKSGFSTALSGTKALQTDTLLPYPVNNESAAVLYSDSLIGGISQTHFSLTFWHYYDTDTLADSCILQMTIDSGKTWSNVIGGGFGYPHIYYSGSLNNYLNGPGSNDTLIWSGQSAGWLKESVCIFYPGAKGIEIPKIFGFRFFFHADSVQTNKPGWIIDDIIIRSPQGTFNVEKLNDANSLTLFPNPSNNGIYHIDYPHSYVTGSIEIYNLYGQRMKQMKLSKTINISDLPKGIYHYRIRFDKTEQLFSGTIQYE